MPCEHIEGTNQSVAWAAKTREDHLCEFSQKMVDLLTEEAARALQAPGHGGLELAACLLQDALRYDALDYRARGVLCKELLEAAQKLRR